MNELQLKELLKSLFRTGQVRIETNIVNNKTAVTSIYIDGVIVAESRQNIS